MTKLTKKETYIINDIKKLADKGLEENNNIAIPMGLVVNKKMIDELKKEYKLTKEIWGYWKFERKEGGKE